MSTLIQELNSNREVNIRIHVRAAIAELKDKVDESPLKTRFHIYSGCVSDEMGIEIAKQLNKMGIKSTFVPGGYIYSRYIDVEVELPDKLKEE